MITVQYRFYNGVKVDATFINNSVKMDWSVPYTKQNIAPLLDEYFNKAIPYIYQEMANITGKSLIWVDTHMKVAPKSFKPK